MSEVGALLPKRSAHFKDCTFEEVHAAHNVPWKLPSGMTWNLFPLNASFSDQMDLWMESIVRAYLDLLPDQQHPLFVQMRKTLYDNERFVFKEFVDFMVCVSYQHGVSCGNNANGGQQQFWKQLQDNSELLDAFESKARAEGGLAQLWEDGTFSLQFVHDSIGNSFRLKDCPENRKLWQETSFRGLAFRKD